LIDPARLEDDGCSIKHLPSHCQRCHGDGLNWMIREPIFANHHSYLATCDWCGLIQQYTSTAELLPPGQH